MAPRAERPEVGHASDQNSETTRRNATPSTRARRKRGPKKDPKKIERARLALELTGGNASAAAKATGIPESSIRRWISDGEFDQDKWDAVRDEKKREAIELAYDGLSAQLDELRVPHHKTVTRPDGSVIDEGPVMSPQAVRAQVEVIRVLGGGPAKAGEEGNTEPVKIEITWPEYDPTGKIVPLRPRKVS